MMRVVMLALASLAACQSLELIPEDRPVRTVGTLAKLAPGQEVQIRHQSSGCFHHEDRVFTFEKRGEGLEVLVGRNRTRGEYDDGDRTLRLSGNDVSDLDLELDHHRSAILGLCTTSVELEVIVRDHGRELRREQVIDRSCPPPRGPSRTTLWSLSRRGRHLRPPAAMTDDPGPSAY